MFKKKTKDRHTQDRSNIYTTGKLGRTRETTPEGYLLCRDVPVARIGKLMYGKGEVPITADDTGLIIVERTADELFNDRTISSFEGKAVTDDHPDDWVSPDNWKNLAVGTAQNVRRGNDIEADFLLADLLITDQSTINKVQDGKVEISLGYDADYTEIGKGKGIQSNILGNHVALVESGRCGSRCSIGDSFMPKADSWLEKKLKGIRRTVDEALAEAKGTEDDDDETKDDDDEPESSKTGDKAVNRQILSMLKTMDKRMTALEKKKTKDSEEPEKKTEDDDDDTQTEDDVLDAEKADTLSKEGVQNHTGDSLQDVLVRAEILSPGFKTPTFDSTNNGNAVLNVKRQVLKQAFTTDAGQSVIKPFIGANTNFDTLPSHTIDAAFIGASELTKQQNNQRGVRTGVSTQDFGRKPLSVAEINANNRAYWANRGSTK